MEIWADDIAQMIKDSEPSYNQKHINFKNSHFSPYQSIYSEDMDQLLSSPESEQQFNLSIEFKSDDQDGDMAITTFDHDSPEDSKDSIAANIDMDETKYNSPRSNHEFLLHPETVINLGSAFEVSSSLMEDPVVQNSVMTADELDGSAYCSSTTNSTGPISETSLLKEEEAPKRLCLVCGDFASGFHYGVASCEACKAFFKRTIQGNIEYQCPSSGECEINKRRRKACQACRYHKCIRVGMLKEGVRLDRVRGGRQKYRKIVQNSFDPCSPPDQRRPSLEDNKTLSALAQAEPDLVVASCESSYQSSDSVLAAIITGKVQGCSGISLLTTLSEVYDRDLVTMIGWAKQVPGFSELPIGDQMRLLQYTWPEVLSLSLAYRSLSKNGRLQFATEVQVSRKQAIDSGLGDFYDYIVQLMDRIEQIGLSKEEYFHLKAIALVNCNCIVEEPGRLQDVKDSLVLSLFDLVAAVRNTSSPLAASQLLLILPCLRQADGIVRETWKKIRRQGRVAMNKLFLEMLEPSVR
ncbi:steroid hormone receptor ERR2-like [Artemia franciscana]|uniref:steroid hormone receptor ERR2-like n=1 Tax=Artemia franciscana TaxID=6661 RepID=UPI0032DACF74